MSFGICGSYEHHLLASEELFHRGIEMVEHLVLIKRHRMSGLSVFLLQAVLAVGPGYRRRLGSYLCDHFNSFMDND